jgi:hypothetical protein
MSYIKHFLNEINTLQEELRLENSIEIYKKAKQCRKKNESKNNYNGCIKIY